MSKKGLKNQLLELIDKDDEVLEEIARRLERTVLFRELREFREETNRRFRELREEMNQRFEAMGWRFDDMENWVGAIVGGFQRKAGKSLEEAVAGTLRVALRMGEVKPEMVKLRQKVTDTDGMIGPAGRTYEYDIFISDGRTWLFEVKATPDEEDIDRFADKCELVAKKLNLHQVKKVVVTLAKTEYLLRRCEERGVVLA